MKSSLDYESTTISALEKGILKCKKDGMPDNAEIELDLFYNKSNPYDTGYGLLDKYGAYLKVRDPKTGREIILMRQSTSRYSVGNYLERHRNYVREKSKEVTKHNHDFKNRKKLKQDYLDEFKIN